MDFANRLMEYLLNHFRSERAFELACGLSNGTIKSVKNGTYPKADSLAKIAVACPDLDIRWLLTGETAVCSEVKPSDDNLIGTIVEAPNSEEIAFLRELVRNQQRIIESLAGKGGNISQSISQ